MEPIAKGEEKVSDVGAGVGDAEQAAPESTLQHIPVDRKGKPDFAAAESAELGFAGLVEMYGDGAAELAESVAQRKAAALKKEKSAKVKLPKMPDDATDADFLEAEAEALRQKKERVAALEEDARRWRAIADVPKRRAEAEKAAAEKADGKTKVGASEEAAEQREAGIVFSDPRTMPDSERESRGEMLRSAKAIDVETNQIVATKELTARKAAERWWDENVGEPSFYDTEVGEVEINRNSIESSLAHRYGQMKLDAITSLVEGFENAVYLGTMPDFTRQEGVNNHFFAYPINYNGERCYVFCRAMQDANKNRLYVHEVFVSDKIKKGDTLQTAASQPHGGIALYRDILANVIETVSKTGPQHPNNAVSSDSSLPINKQNGISSIELKGEPNVSDHKDRKSLIDEQISEEESSLQPTDDKDSAFEQLSAQTSGQSASAELNTDPTHAQSEFEKAEAEEKWALTKGVDQARTNINEEGLVVNGDGRPLVLYHGTPNAVESVTDLEAGHQRGNEDGARFNGDGVSFTPDRTVAEDYANDGNTAGKVFEVNVRLKNPFYTVGVAHFTPEEAAEFTAELKAKGHDGIINYSSKAMREIGEQPQEVIVFGKESIIPIPEKAAAEKAAAEKVEMERRVKEEERADREAKAKLDKLVRHVYDEVKDVPEALERLEQTSIPEDIYEVAAIVLTQNKLLMRSKSGAKGVMEDTGFGEYERKKLFGMFRTKENGGKSLGRLAEDAMEELCEQYGIHYDNQEAHNVLIEMVRDASVPSDIYNYIVNKRIGEARKLARDYHGYIEGLEDAWCRETFGMSRDEYIDMREVQEEEAKKALEDLDYDENNAILAEEKLREEEYEQRRFKQIDASAEGEGGGGGGTLLPDQGTDKPGGGGGISQEPGSGGVAVGEGGGDAQGLPEGASGRGSLSKESGEGDGPMFRDGDAELAHGARLAVHHEGDEWWVDVPGYEGRATSRKGMMDSLRARFPQYGFVPTLDGEGVVVNHADKPVVNGSDVVLSHGQELRVEDAGEPRIGYDGKPHYTQCTHPLLPGRVFEGVYQLAGALEASFPGWRAEAWPDGRISMWHVQDLDKARAEKAASAGRGVESRGGLGVGSRGFERGRMLANAIARTHSMAQRLGLPVDYVMSEELPEGELRGKKGWYDQKTGRITVVVDNHGGEGGDLLRTLLHEGVGHRGLRAMFGEHFDDFLDAVYENGDGYVHSRIEEYMRGEGGDRRRATEEYLATLAEDNHVSQPWIRRVCKLFFEMLDSVGLLRVAKGVTLSDADLRYLLWRSHQNLVREAAREDVAARDAEMQRKLGLDRADGGKGIEPARDDTKLSGSHVESIASEPSLFEGEQPSLFAPEDFGIAASKVVKGDAGNGRQMSLFDEQSDAKADGMSMKDKQGNPINQDGSLYLEKVENVQEIGDDDFNGNIGRNIELPKVSNRLSSVVPINGRTVIIKSNVFKKVKNGHSELSADQSRAVIEKALYSTDIAINDKPTSKPNYWILVNVGGHNALLNIDTDPKKVNVEIVGWRSVRNESLEQIKNRAKRDGGQIIITREGAAGLSALTDGEVSGNKGNTLIPEKQMLDSESGPSASHSTKAEGEVSGVAGGIGSASGKTGGGRSASEKARGRISELARGENEGPLDYAARVSAEYEAALDSERDAEIRADVERMELDLAERVPEDPEEVRGEIGELQSMWEELALRHGEEPQDEEVRELMGAIETAIATRKRIDFVLAEGGGSASEEASGEASRSALTKVQDNGTASEGDSRSALTRPQNRDAAEGENNAEGVAPEGTGKAGGIDDWGEEIYGARKNALRDLSKQLSGVTAADLVANPVSKVFKPKDWVKLAAKGEITAEDARVLEAMTRLILRDKKPSGLSRNSYANRRRQEEIKAWAERTAKLMDGLRRYAEAGTAEERAAALESMDLRDMEAMRDRRAQVLEWNPDRKDGGHYAPNELETVIDIMDSLDVPATPFGKAKLLRIDVDM